MVFIVPMKNSFIKNLVLVLLLSSSPSSYAQKSSYIVTGSNDTIYVEKFNITIKEIRTKLNTGEKKTFAIDNLKFLYNSKKKKKYRKIAPAFVEYSKNSGTVFFAEQLTEGKVKIFRAEISHSHTILKPADYNKYCSYYIAIHDYPPELIHHEWDLKLTKDVYKLLKLYLHSNENIAKKLDDLFFLKEEDPEIEAKIIALVNEYNRWASSEN